MGIHHCDYFGRFVLKNYWKLSDGSLEWIGLEGIVHCRRPDELQRVEHLKCLLITGW